jgi:hypothetical protein
MHNLQNSSSMVNDFSSYTSFAASNNLQTHDQDSLPINEHNQVMHQTSNSINIKNDANINQIIHSNNQLPSSNSLISLKNKHKNSQISVASSQSNINQINSTATQSTDVTSFNSPRRRTRPKSKNSQIKVRYPNTMGVHFPKRRKPSSQEGSAVLKL